MRTTLAIALCLLALPACFMPMPPQNSGGSSAPSSGGTGSEPANAAAPAEAGSAPKEAVGPQTDSVTLHNDCSKTVKLFLGEKPKFGSGTSTTIGSNTTQSHTLGVGKMIWIVDDSENGVAQYVGQAGMHRIKIPASCNQFQPD